MVDTPKTTIPIISSNDVQVNGDRIINGGAPVPMELAQTNIEQGVGFKASKSTLTHTDGSMVTEYRLDVEGTHTTATLSANGTAVLSTTRGRVSDNATPGEAEQAFGAAVAKGLNAPASGATAQQEAKNFAAVMEKAFADKKISPAELANLTELNGSAQSLPARGPRTGGITH